MIPSISNDNVAKVAEVFSTFDATAWRKAEAVLPLLLTLSTSERWLLSFVSYLLSHNKMWQKIDESHYYFLPTSQEQQSTFDDFVILLRTYGSKKITHKNEGMLVKFLIGCSSQFKDFYVSLMAQPNWLRNVFMSKEVREFIDIDSVTIEDIYPKPTLLSNGLHILSYPLIVTAIPTTNLEPALLYRSSNSLKICSFRYTNMLTKKVKKTRIPASWLSLDRTMLHYESFVLLGMIDIEAGHFYPLDFFNGLKEHSKARHKKPSYSYEERLEQLRKFLDTHFLRQIKSIPKKLCFTEEQVMKHSTVALSTGLTTVLMADSRNRTYYIDSTEKEGVIGGIWIEDGEAKGFEVWNNLSPQHCTFDFSGANNALLYRPDIVIGKHVKFYSFSFKNHIAGTVKEILWDKLPYRKTPITLSDGSKGWIERCPICLRDDTPQWAEGVCRSTFMGWATMLGSRGKDKWFSLSRKILKRREALQWDMSCVNKINIFYKGFKVIANELGHIMFVEDAQAKEAHIEALKRHKMTEVRTTVEDMRRSYESYYNLKGVSDETDGTGNLC